MSQRIWGYQTRILLRVSGLILIASFSFIPSATFAATPTDTALLSALTGILQTFSQMLSAMPQQQLAASGANAPITVAAFAPSQRIDQLANVTISNATVSGVSGLTVGDIPDLSSRYLPVSGGTISGSIVFTNATSTNFFATVASSTNLFAQSASLGSLTLATPLGISSGGTGTSTAPSYGQVLVGNNAGTYTPTATSSLGILSSLITGAWQREGTVLDGSQSLGGGGSISAQEVNVMQESTCSLIPSSSSCFKMIFTGQSSGQQGLFYAESVDGVTNWKSSPTSLVTNHRSSFWVKSGSTYYLYAANANWTQIDLYTASASGGPYTLAQAGVIVPGGGSTWDAQHVTNMGGVIVDGTLYMYLEGYTSGVGQNGTIGLFTSTNMVTFTQPVTNPVISISGSAIGGPTNPILVGNTWYMWVHNCPNITGACDIFMYSAPSLTASSWTPSANNPVFARQTSDEGPNTNGQVADPFVLQSGGKTYLYYTADSNSTAPSAGYFKVKLAVADMPVSALVATAQGSNVGTFAIGSGTLWYANAGSSTYSGGDAIISQGGIKTAGTIGLVGGSYGEMDYNAGTTRFTTQSTSTDQVGLFSFTAQKSDGSSITPVFSTNAAGGTLFNHAMGIQGTLSVTTGGASFTGNTTVTGNFNVTNAFSLAQITPASQTASCTGFSGASNIDVDANFIYVCTSANNWKSIPLAPFQSTAWAFSGSNISNGNTGNVGIGTTTPYSTLEVWSPSSSGTTSVFSVVSNASSTLFAVYANGNATYAGSIFNSSDQRLKTNIVPLTPSSSLSALEAMNPVSYTRIDQPDTGTNLGFLAQQVQSIYPNLVSTTSATALTPDGTLTVNYQGLIAPIVSAIQQLSDTINGFADSFTTKELTFERATGNEIDVQKLCVGSTCLTESKLQALLASANQPGSSGVTDDSTTSPEAPVIQINDNNPAIINIGSIYNDPGATITGPQADINLGIATFLNGVAMSPIVLDTTQAATDTIDYVVTDSNGLVSTSTRTVIVQ